MSLKFAKLNLAAYIDDAAVAQATKEAKFQRSDKKQKMV